MTAAPPRPPRIVAYTAGGLARESGFSPFDPAAIPAGLRLEELVTREGFEHDAERVNGFYNLRRRELGQAKPNAAHEALAVLDAVRRREVLIVTRNLDDLHERAGSQRVIHTHGELLKARCLICTNVSERYNDVTAETACAVCGNAGHLRPHIVWVGEAPLGIATVFEALALCRLFLVVGAPLTGEPITGFLAAARRAGARTVELNSEPSSASGACDERIAGPLVESVPDYVKRLIALG